MFDHIECFYRPGTLREALALLQKTWKRGAIVAGATDVATRADRSPHFFIDVTRLDLDYVRKNGRGCTIGAVTTMMGLEKSSIIR